MAYDVSFDVEIGIVQVTYSGTTVRDDHYAAFDIALRLCREHACSRLLVDFTGLSDSKVSTMQSFDFAQFVARNPLNLRIAHVLPMNPKARENVLFASSVEANRGSKTGEFETIEQARNWLRSKT